MPEENYWVAPLGQSPAIMRSTASRLVIVEHSDLTTPVTVRGQAWDRVPMPSGLRDRIFDPVAAASSTQTYLLMDAGVRSQFWGVFDPEDVDLPCRCLFKGRSAVELKSVAPYLVDLTMIEEPSRFHKAFLNRDWVGEEGILIQSEIDMDHMWQHLRRFTKVRTPQGTAAYFRFWDPRLLLYFLRACSVDELDRFFPTPTTRIWMVTRSRLFGQAKVTSATLARD